MMKAVDTKQQQWASRLEREQHRRAVLPPGAATMAATDRVHKRLLEALDNISPRCLPSLTCPHQPRARQGSSPMHAARNRFPGQSFVRQFAGVVLGRWISLREPASLLASTDTARRAEVNGSDSQR